MYLKLTKKLKVHSWGGFGSQLFAAAVIIKLKRLYPESDVQLIHHTGGVTYRNFELPGNFPKPIKIINDKVNRSEQNISSFRLRLLLSKYLKNTLLRIGVVKNFNSDLDFDRVSKKTLQIRGHYSYLKLEDFEIESILKLLRNASQLPENFHNLDLVIHYRLGDLTDLDIKKAPTDIESLKSIMKNITSGKKFKSVLVMTDTPEQAKLNFKDIKFNKIYYEQNTPLNTILIGTFSKKFIGTNSKLSIWISILRSHLFNGERETFMPKNLQLNLEKILEIKAKQIFYF